MYLVGVRSQIYIYIFIYLCVSVRICKSCLLGWVYLIAYGAVSSTYAIYILYLVLWFDTTKVDLILQLQYAIRLPYVELVNYTLIQSFGSPRTVL